MKYVAPVAELVEVSVNNIIMASECTADECLLDGFDCPDMGSIM